ncbi:MAG: GNAT family N-acetyltransferase [Nanoarchaeota archaeon]|nr:GNAT family N-acetyltransferase [Nanoarchaeota archaeon]MBU1321800.1 GNAT family N-acetyltransferase [Nanoarchaeota archaeon]MBU1598247.1 GNAT family N-acetyltransferase [Nanoarchaeota archaeon]MBU2441724.1 GNAT family N-acetyltransferase [Nanoarchaeota archaeon]
MIRKIEKKDLESLIEIHGYSVNNKDDVKEFIRRQINKSDLGYIMAEQGEEIGFTFVKDLPVGLLFSGPTIIKKGFRQRGYASKLMDFVEKKAHESGYSTILLVTAKDNQIAEKYQSSQGYTPIEEFKQGKIWIKELHKKSTNVQAYLTLERAAELNKGNRVLFAPHTSEKSEKSEKKYDLDEGKYYEIQKVILKTEKLESRSYLRKIDPFDYGTFMSTHFIPFPRTLTNVFLELKGKNKQKFRYDLFKK